MREGGVQGARGVGGGYRSGHITRTYIPGMYVELVDFVWKYR